MENLSKNTNLSEQEIQLLREKFINKYSKEKGWNPNNLTTQQLLEITTQKEYKSPGLLLS